MTLFSSCIYSHPLLLQAGSLLVHSTRIPVPSLPKWVESGLARLLGRDTPPKRYSGASLQVQRQQRMDEMENMLQQIQQRQVELSYLLNPFYYAADTRRCSVL